ncbi:fasciclin domain-containing protein [Mycolicibacterium sp. 120270]|uniref:fasciclin domain-containing protein n=1 Tax=Mycolicibacterium sp. 120270 TaxID=3090600 RepID=UPI00299E933E|nr:fasciclin domain-containing protein [Mycolicibacterium sp. 120270]MDX1886303.1 fasciclin domain-containing protein [Mycolicibacterium sp. 120270]
MRNVHRSTLTAATIAALAVLGLSACSNDSSAAEQTAEAEKTSSSASAMSPATAQPAGTLIGAGCAAYAEQVPDGPGSVAGMAQDPVTVAASNNPMLKTLTQALSGQLNPNVNLVDTLNGGEFTVFAPTDDAFAKIDPATIEKLKTDSDLLTSILTYHVVPGQASPAKVVGSHETVQGADVTVTGEGNGLKVNDAGLVCGGVSTANAQVYMIDTVLMPPAA